MVVVSQIWIQHLHCTQIIGHCHLRAGSMVEPELAGSLYTAMVVALAEVENEFLYTMSGFYGYRIPDIEGIGLFTVSNKKFRIFFLCEGLYKKGIPYLAGKKISSHINSLFKKLEEKVPHDTCKLAHKLEKGSYWFDLMCAAGFGGEINIDTIQTIYPLRSVSIHTCQDDKTSSEEKISVLRIESSELGSLGYGWKDRDEMVATKIEGIFMKPQRSFVVYRTLFQQIKEFVPGFEPNTIVLTYQQRAVLDMYTALVGFLSLKENMLDIRYCIPVPVGLGIAGYQTPQYLRSLIFE